MKFMISAQLPIHANGKAKVVVRNPNNHSTWCCFPVFIATSITNAFNSLIISE